MFHNSNNDASFLTLSLISHQMSFDNQLSSEPLLIYIFPPHHGEITRWLLLIITDLFHYAAIRSYLPLSEGFFAALKYT